MFLEKISGNHRTFVGSSQQSPLGLWRISQHTANSLQKSLWRACQRSCGVTANAAIKVASIEHNANTFNVITQRYVAQLIKH